MATNYLGVGDVIEVTAGAGGVTKDTIYKGTNRGGVHLATAASGVSTPVALEGIFTVTKKAAATLDFAVGEKVYILTTGGVNKAVPVTGGSTISLGFAVEAAATGATTVKVKLAGF